MKSLLILSLMGVLCAGVFASSGNKRQVDNRVPVRLQIRHANPWTVKAMLEGRSPNQPEISTLAGIGLGQTGQSGQNNQNVGSSALLKDGFLVVNPTDNSLWWYPKK